MNYQVIPAGEGVLEYFQKLDFVGVRFYGVEFFHLY
jgi:hypothetical protein